MREQDRAELVLTKDSKPDDEEQLLPPTALQTFTLFSNGHSVEEIARQRSLVVSTIEGHLLECLDAGFVVDISRLVSDAQRKQIEKAISSHGLEGGFKPIRESLPESITYNMIRFVVAAKEQ
jgi:ATP-dependent DNA helicase RecQ